jgi:hypothetical protein
MTNALSASFSASLAIEWVHTRQIMAKNNAEA